MLASKYVLLLGPVMTCHGHASSLKAACPGSSTA